MGKILTKDRIKKINFLDKQINKAVKEMIKREKNPVIKTAYEKVLYNLTIPKNFYPRDSLVSAIFKIGEHFVASEILGQHKQNLKIERHGNTLKVIPQGEIIEIPIDLLFYGGGDKLTWKGVHTYLHELSHDPLRDPIEFSKLGLDRTQREELVADLLSARLAVKMGYSREKIFELYKGRQSVYGANFPFEEMLEKATRPKKITEFLKKMKTMPKKVKEKWQKGMERRREKKRKPTPVYRPAFRP